jgi:hypothetical protein
MRDGGVLGAPIDSANLPSVQAAMVAGMKGPFAHTEAILGAAQPLSWV